MFYLKDPHTNLVLLYSHMTFANCLITRTKSNIMEHKSHNSVVSLNTNILGIKLLL